MIAGEDLAARVDEQLRAGRLGVLTETKSTPAALQAALVITVATTIVLGVVPGLVGRYGELSDLTGAFGR